MHMHVVDAGMTGRPTSLDRRLLDALRASTHGTSVHVLVGGCGSGRTERLQRLHHELGPRSSQYIDLERVSTTPERCFRAVMNASPFIHDGVPAGGGFSAGASSGVSASGHAGGSARETASGARPAFDAMLMFLMNASNADGSPATFLLDEILELRTFESFPGLRSALPELARALAHSRNRFIVSTRFTARARRWIEAAPERFELVPVTPLAPADVRDTLGGETLPSEADEIARVIHRLSDGRPRYTRALLDEMIAQRKEGAADPISALAASLSPNGELDGRCRFSYELRLHRARGYGALKAILQVLSEEEPLTLTQIAQRLDRTAGSTKDYLSWLQDVDMLTCQRKRYTFADPLLRLWVRIYSHPEPPTEERLAREVQSYAMARLQTIDVAPPAERARAAGSSRVITPASSGIIEID
jgi:hypothetical protein